MVVYLVWAGAELVRLIYLFVTKQKVPRALTGFKETLSVISGANV